MLSLDIHALAASESRSVCSITGLSLDACNRTLCLGNYGSFTFQVKLAWLAEDNFFFLTKKKKEISWMFIIENGGGRGEQATHTNKIAHNLTSQKLSLSIVLACFHPVVCVCVCV